MNSIDQGPDLMRRTALLAAVTLMLAACGAGSPTATPTTGTSAAPTATAASTAAQITLNTIFMKQAAYTEDDVKGMSDAFTAAHPNVHINLEFVAYEGLHDKIVTGQVGGGGQYDLVLMDTPWPAEFADAKIVRDITSLIPADYKSGVFDSAWTAATYKDKIYGVPWINDTKFFFYNQDMLTAAGITTAPKTWDDVVTAAKAIKTKGTVQYPLVWSWTQAEAVICDWAQLAGAMGGADFIDAQGNALFNTGGGLAALTFMKQTLDDGITNPASLGYIEDEVNNTVGAGQAAMALNWTYGFSVMNDPAKSTVAGKVKVTAAPGEGTTTTSGVNGGMSIAVTTSTQHPDEALQYALWMASQPMQEKYDESTLPMWKASFSNTAITGANPDLFAAAQTQFGGLIARPVVPYYSKLSSALQVAIQKALKGTVTPKAALDDVAAQLPTLQQ